MKLIGDSKWKLDSDSKNEPNSDSDSTLARFSEYQRLSAADKTSYHHSRMREPALRCPGCDMALQPDDLLAHQSERCSGRGEPHHLSRWITGREALKLGLTRKTLARWVSQGHIRARGKTGPKQYLARDVIHLIALRRVYLGI